MRRDQAAKRLLQPPWRDRDRASPSRSSRSPIRLDRRAVHLEEVAGDQARPGRAAACSRIFGATGVGASRSWLRCRSGLDRCAVHLK